MKCVCWWCGGDLCWDSDAEDDEGNLETYLHCIKCGAEVTYTHGDAE